MRHLYSVGVLVLIIIFLAVYTEILASVREQSEISFDVVGLLTTASILQLFIGVFLSLIFIDVRKFKIRPFSYIAWSGALVFIAIYLMPYVGFLPNSTYFHLEGTSAFLLVASGLLIMAGFFQNRE
ncbi:hypothetical protein ACE1TF_14990 [Geomicrobium sp. JSM 1781026]|uniref:hypothetical protein n=1 Tax=Geomicrobium sp. JSM 1781026 TaxID=3344580 RepID=UPI0035BF2E4A